ncbi:sugar transferase [Dysgonomonas sp. 511]|uniref:sugar transferase n=1 Tax=Dysgonomonas sp. 511 TaxID=2302930 RepID=UPI0013D73C3E|nr:sugar transferase [Dysgonomonas sp. 511]NDV77726.1 sugar transferase [Dysgonomonas sp. 511]
MNRLLENTFGYKGIRLLTPLLDLLIIHGAYMLSFYILKEDLENFAVNYNAYWAILPYIVIAYLIISHVFELDKPKDFSIFGIGYTVSLVIVLLLAFTMAVSFFIREFALPRSILLISAAFQVLFISIWHLLTNKIYYESNKRKTVLVIGREKSQPLAYKLLESRGMWSQIKHVCAPDHPKVYDYIDECDVTFLTEDVEESLKQEIVFYCVEKDQILLYQPKNTDILQFNGNIVQIDDSPLLDVRELGLSGSSESLKRILDVLLSTIALVIFLIPGFIIYLILKTGGSAFYMQERMTRNNRIFKIYKFRTMVQDAEAISGPILASNKDSRITKLGRILRATRLDEIPQIYNILVGDMSIVGPRPERPVFVEQFAKEIPEYNLRHRVKAGLTGLAQVQGKYNTTVRDKLKYDLLYINGYSFALDLKLIMQTMNIILRLSSTEGVKSVTELEEEVEKLTRRQ